MAAARPEILVLAGVNGAGKSSVAGARIRNAGGQFYNPDLYARQLQIAQPGLSIEEANGQAWQHGRGLLERAISTQVNYAFESTLGGTTIPELLRRAAASHDVRVLFVGLDTRFTSSRANLIDLLRDLASLRLYDNSIEVAADESSVPLPRRLLEMEAGVITYQSPRGSIPDWAKAIVQAARDQMKSRRL